MTLAIVSTTPGDQGLANRLGKLGAILTAQDTWRGTTLPGLVEAAVELFDGCSPEIRALPAPLNPTALAAWRAGTSPEVLRTAAQAMMIDQIDRADPLPKRTLEEALSRFFQTMVGSYNVAANTVGAAVTKTSLTGNGHVVVSTKNGSGYDLHTLLAEDLLIRVEAATTPGAETLRILGETAVDRMSYLWPRGSGSSRTFQSLLDTAAGNKITNGSFDAFTGNIPDGWTITTGAHTTHVIKEDTLVYRSGGNALKMAGDGSTLTKLTTTASIRSRLLAKQPYAVAFPARMSTAGPGAGVLRCDLFDGSSVINDEAGNANSFNVDLTALANTYTWQSGTFRLPEPLPDNVYLRLWQPTPLSNTYSVYVDALSLWAMQQPDSKSLGTTPWVAIASGSSPWSLDDGDPAPGNATVFKITTTNNWAGAWLRFLERVYELSKLAVYPPTSGGSTISASLLT